MDSEKAQERDWDDGEANKFKILGEVDEGDGVRFTPSGTSGPRFRVPKLGMTLPLTIVVFAVLAKLFG